ncbi:Uncharacterised protein [Chryseobacterium gleum]|uniref:Uncharacterized protein n=2 Tax=Chryseobacterium gleum TaxID=250 RepID=A0A448B847_CHRGE|nr:hypothetical protein [Chryseobacterium gleum]EFK36780.1 hypothetical protein HMPREF0204_11337 [Chryseobacterium gleum ATCC 35910]QQY32036.1 hypothetical protein I6I60_24940 [Chryseobacterium gleum]VEE10743.1 Uncharacterised protein [Chryseobacterium gleum]
MNLLNMTDFVLQQREEHYSRNTDKIEVIESYAHFLKQPLALGMFVPVDFVGNVLNEPKIEEYDILKDILIKFNFENDLKRYNEINKKVLFEGWTHEDRYGWVQHHELGLEINTETGTLAIFHENGIGYGYVKKVEDLVSYALTLTPSALEAIGIK